MVRWAPAWIGGTQCAGAVPEGASVEERVQRSECRGTATTPAYGSDGLRRLTVQGSTTTDFVLDGQSVVRTLTNGVLDRTFLHGARGPEHERIGANAPGWYAYDGLGSVLGIVDGGGNLTSVRKYDVYGGVRGLTGQSGSKHKWVGGLGHPSEDETGLIYMRARYYDPAVGRFASEDPAKDGENWFAYADGNPAIKVDADGCVAGSPTTVAIYWAALGKFYAAALASPMARKIAYTVQTQLAASPMGADEPLKQRTLMILSLLIGDAEREGAKVAGVLANAAGVTAMYAAQLELAYVFFCGL